MLLQSILTDTPDNSATNRPTLQGKNTWQIPIAKTQFVLECSDPVRGLKSGHAPKFQHLTSLHLN